MKKVEIEGRTVDVASCRGCSRPLCPVPIVKLSLQIEEVKEGEVVELLADDPGILRDLSVWCKEMGYKILMIREENGVVVAYVEKNEIKGVLEQIVEGFYKIQRAK